MRAKFTGALATHPVKGGTLVWDWSGDFPTLDPITWQDLQSQIPMNAIYSTLVKYAKDSTKIVPGIATYTVSNGGLKYVFTLRQGAQFSNGDPVTATDVKWSFDRASSYATKYAPSSQGAAPYGSSFSDVVGYNAWFKKGTTAKDLSGIKVLGPNKLEIDLKQPQAYFLNELALPVADILDPAVVQKYSSTTAYEQHAVGSGPYMLKVWNRNKDMILVPNPHYNGPNTPYLSKVVFNVNVPASTQYLLFKQGKDDIVYQPDSATYLSVINDPKLKTYYHKQATNAIWYLAFNTTKAPFNNATVRKAVNMAIDRKPIMRLINGRGTIMTQPIPPAMIGYQKTFPTYTYNPTQAKALLKQAHATNLHITYAYTSGRPFTKKVAENIQQQLSNVGITVNLKNIAQTGSYWPFTSNAKGNWNIAWSDWWQDYPDPQDFLFNLLDGQNVGSLNVAAWNNKQFNKDVEQADILPASQQSQRVKLYDQAQKIWYQQAPWIPLFYPVLDSLVQPWVGPNDPNVIIHPVLGPNLRYIFVAQH